MTHRASRRFRAPQPLRYRVPLALRALPALPSGFRAASELALLTLRPLQHVPPLRELLPQLLDLVAKLLTPILSFALRALSGFQRVRGFAKLRIATPKLLPKLGNPSTPLHR